MAAKTGMPMRPDGSKAVKVQIHQFGAVEHIPKTPVTTASQTSV
jgi:hypothetical protein